MVSGEMINNGGVQYVPQLAAVQQIIYLDFDGETTSYNGGILFLENVEVQNSSLTEERITNIVTALNEKYASQNVVFVTEHPVDTEYSTIFIGKTSAFDSYGNFTGVAETIDIDNKNKSDNAFVSLDAVATDSQIIATIAHETDHLLGTLNHGGEGLEAYAYDQRYDVSSGVTSTGVTLYYDSMYVSSGGVANNTTLNDWGFMHVSSGGTANSTTVNSYGSLYVSSGGTANSTTVNFGGCLYVYECGTANSTTVNSRGYLCVSSGGTANITTVNEWGSMHVSSGGTVNSTTVNFNGYLYVSSGGTANSTTVNYGGGLYVSSGGTVNSTTVNAGGDLYVSSGGTANSCTVNYEGHLRVYGGGTANNTTVNELSDLYVFSGGTANSTTVNYDGKLMIEFGGTASIVFNPWQGIIDSRYGAVVEYLERDANVYYGDKTLGLISKADTASGLHIASNTSAIVYEGGSVESSTVSFLGNFYVSSGGIVNNTTANFYGNLHVSAGGIANSTTVNFYGNVYVGGTVKDTVMDYYGCLSVLSGGIASNTVTAGGATLCISSGGVHKGSLQIEKGAVVSACSEGMIDFTLSERSTDDDFLVNDLSLISGTPTFTITVSAAQGKGTYKLAQGAAEFEGTITIGDGSVDYGTVTVNGSTLEYGDKRYALIQRDGSLTLTVTGTKPMLSGNKNGIVFTDLEGAVIQYSTDDFKSVLQLETDKNAVDIYGMPAGTYQWRASEKGSCWFDGNDIVADNVQTVQKFISDADGDTDLFFATADSIWKEGFAAQHLGNGIWEGTGEQLLLNGKNKLADIFKGSEDANILVLTDDANGDALFVDDIYTALGNQARFSQIDEIRAGAGDDIVDMTSQQFAYEGDGITIYGGAGNDTIWANNGENILFGDDGNDRIVGGSGDDVIVGGAGDDSLHGGGGNDIFTFGANWGNDTVEQLASGSITLWFETGSVDNWNNSTWSYSDGVNTVTVTGTTDITLMFGNSGKAVEGAFLEGASEKIFEDEGKGFIA